MTADPTGFDRLRDEALAAVAAAGDLAALKTVVLVEEAATGPSWNAVALRSALVAMTVERDDLRAAHERLDRDGRAVAGRCLHYEARAKKAEAAIARVRARHVKALGTDACEECSSWSLYRKVVPWPCATIRALDRVAPMRAWGIDPGEAE